MDATQLELPFEWEDTFFEDAENILKHEFMVCIGSEDIFLKRHALNIYKELNESNTEVNVHVDISESQKQIDNEVELMPDGVDPRTDD